MNNSEQKNVNYFVPIQTEFEIETSPQVNKQT